MELSESERDPRIAELTQNGYSIFEAEDNEPIEKSRQLICDYLRRENNLDEQDNNKLLNEIHKYMSINDSIANQLVLNTITEYKKTMAMDETVYKCMPVFMTNLLGQDIASQRNPNIVFQYPKSERFSELHADAPANSPYELVVWVPLVDCYETKSFYIVDVEQSLKLLKVLKEGKFECWEDMKDKVKMSAKNLTISYGQVLVFWSGLLHGSQINETNESRWSLNTRFKNLFAPCGLKDPFSFYKVLKTSPLTRLANR